MKTTISAIKADIGGFPGHSTVHPELKLTAERLLKKSPVKDHRVLSCGDDMCLIMSHNFGADNEKVHSLAWKIFEEATKVAKKLKLYGAGQDLLSDAFSGNVKGMGPGVAELEFEERKSDPIIVFAADKTESGAFNYPLYKMFADPFNTVGLVIDPNMTDGFVFEILDVVKDKTMKLKTPEDSYELLLLLGSTGRFCIKSIKSKSGEPAASVSTTKLNMIAGKYVGKDDPVCITRGQSGLPAVGELLEPFAKPFFVKGWMRGSHHGPLMPVPFHYAKPTRFDGPPRVTAAGFQIANGALVGPVDMFDDPGFDRARQEANRMADFMRRMGPFEPHRLGLEEMEYTTMPKVMEKLGIEV